MSVNLITQSLSKEVSVHVSLTVYLFCSDVQTGPTIWMTNQFADFALHKSIINAGPNIDK